MALARSVSTILRLPPRLTTTGRVLLLRSGCDATWRAAGLRGLGFALRWAPFTSCTRGLNLLHRWRVSDPAG